MKILKLHTSEGMTHANELTAAIRQSLADHTKAFSYLLEDGWRCQIHAGKAMEAMFFYDLQSDIGGGNWAEAKLRTMLNASRPTVTHMMNVREFVETLSNLAEKVDSVDEPAVNELLVSMKEIDYPDDTDADSLLGEVDLHLLNSIGLAPYYGGICAEYSVITANGTYDDTLYIAFSGATQEQDVFFAMHLLGQIQGIAAEIYKEASIEWSLKAIENDPCTKMWMQLYGMK